MKTLILSNSFDVTTDLLVQGVGSEHIFRLNSDLWRDYQLEWTRSGCILRSPTSKIESENIAKCLWRKPFPDVSQSQSPVGAYVRSELRYIFRELFAFFLRNGKSILVDPLAGQRIGKITQALIATAYFDVPDWTAVLNARPRLTSPLVAKSLASTPLADGKRFFTQPINVEEIDLCHPWFLQSLVEASHDLTVVYISGDCFGFALDRSSFSAVDWRSEFENHGQTAWTPYAVSNELRSAIHSFMRDCGLHFGRLDFLLRDNRPVFLEVNPNGQWAWLDLNGANGLLRRMVEEVSPTCSRFTPACR